MTDSDFTKNEDDRELDEEFQRILNHETDLEIKGLWSPTEEISHAFEPTFIADHSGSGAGTETPPKENPRN